jgi:hypothetical protein
MYDGDVSWRPATERRAFYSSYATMGCEFDALQTTLLNRLGRFVA